MINMSNVIINQALHGYSQGHQQLAMTASLEPEDQSTILSASDISASGLKIDADGYITGYPLRKSGVYILSKTWLANEMPRPGCVWTHSLIIDFSDLATMQSTKDILSLFKRPLTPLNKNDYSKPIQFDNRTSTDNIINLNIEEESWLRSLIYTLYLKHDKQIIQRSIGNRTQEFCLRVWLQQWPKLRRSFSFSTLSVSDRQIDNSSLDLHILAANDYEENIQYFQNSQPELKCDNANHYWVDTILSDISNENGLRSFLKIYGSEFGTNRTGFVILSEIYRNFSNKNLQECISLIEKHYDSKKSTHIKKLISKEILISSNKLSDAYFTFLLTDIDQLADLVEKSGIDFGYELWNRQPVEYAKWLISENKERYNLAKPSLMNIDSDKLIDSLQHEAALLAKIADLSPILTTKDTFWKHIPTSFISNSIQIADEHNLKYQAVKSVLTSDRTDIVSEISKHLDVVTMMDLVSSTKNKISTSMLEQWVSSAIEKKTEFVDFFTSSNLIQNNIIKIIVRKTNPDYIPTSKFKDPWESYISRNNNHLLNNDDHFLSYIFCRGFKNTKNLSLLRDTIDLIIPKLKSNSLSSESLSLMDLYLSRYTYISSWNRNKKVLEAVAMKCLELNADPNDVLDLTNDKKIFMDLIDNLKWNSKSTYLLNGIYESIGISSKSFFSPSKDEVRSKWLEYKHTQSS